ncbi:hypothetical protein TNCV_18511 [Trichonephila clavipes]|nr:hypothetical protein TNCV_18511 [Trichonephila clavipes]
MFPGRSTSLTALFHGCSHLKLLNVVDGTGGRVRSNDACRRQIYRPISKRNRRITAAQQVANQFLAASGKQICRKTVAKRLRGEDYTHADLLCVSH